MNADGSDRQIMLALAGGSDAAFAELMRRWEAPVWCFIDRMCGRLDCTDDIYQEVWTRVYLYRTRFDRAQRFRPYLFTITANCCRAALARFKRRRFFEVGLDDAAPPVDDCPGPPDVLIAGRAREQLRRAVARLPGAQRSVVLLYLLFSTDYGEIARALGKSPGTVRSHMHHALKKLRAILGRITVEPESQVDDGRLVN